MRNHCFSKKLIHITLIFHQKMTRATRNRNPKKYKNFSKTKRALLFSLFVNVKSRKPPVKPCKIVSTIANEYEKQHGESLGAKSIRVWVKKWEKSDSTVVLERETPKTYRSKRKRVGGQISSSLQTGRSARSVAFDGFDDEGKACTISRSTAVRAGVFLKVKPSCCCCCCVCV